jgi:hypothetical protein
MISSSSSSGSTTRQNSSTTRDDHSEAEATTSLAKPAFHAVADATLDFLAECLEGLEKNFDDLELTVTDGVLKLDFASHGRGAWVRVLFLRTVHVRCMRGVQEWRQRSHTSERARVGVCRYFVWGVRRRGAR